MAATKCSRTPQRACTQPYHPVSIKPHSKISRGKMPRQLAQKSAPASQHVY